MRLGNAAAVLAVADQMDAVSGGTPVFGEAGGHGRAGRWSVAVTSRRVGREATEAPVAPLRSGLGSGPASEPRRVDAKAGQSFGVTSSLGVLSGFAVGQTRVFSLDLLVGLTWIGDSPATSLGVTNGGLARTIGGRLGIVQETARLPGIGVAITSTALPAVSIRAAPLALDAGVGDVLLRVDNFTPVVLTRRVTIGKRFGRLGISAGVGEEQVDDPITTSVSVTPTSGLAFTETENAALHLRRTSRVLGASWDLGALLIGMEVGQVRGGVGSSPEPRPLRSRSFVTVGARIGSR